MIRRRATSRSLQGSEVRLHHWSPPTSRLKTKVGSANCQGSVIIHFSYASSLRVKGDKVLTCELRIVSAFRECQSKVYTLYGLQYALHSRYGQAVSGATGCRHQAPRYTATRRGESCNPLLCFVVSSVLMGNCSGYCVTQWLCKQ